MEFKTPDSILLISCYELGNQPLGVAPPLGFLERAGFAPQAMDIAVERFDAEQAARASFIGISLPMHTAMRPTWVAFTPWTTREDYCEMLHFTEANGLIDHIDPVQFVIRLLIPPGSWLAEHADTLPHRGSLDEAAFTYRWTHLPIRTWITCSRLFQNWLNARRKTARTPRIRSIRFWTWPTIANRQVWRVLCSPIDSELRV